MNNYNATYIKVTSGKHEGLSGYVLRDEGRTMKCKTFVDGKEYKFDVKFEEVKFLGGKV